ncbi:hypothetical protein NHX12_014833, partial [Muraenolepis orangiensis]
AGVVAGPSVGEYSRANGPGSADSPPQTLVSPQTLASPTTGLVQVVPVVPVVPLTVEPAAGQSPSDPQLSPLTSPLLMEAGYVRTDDEDEARRKKFPTDKAYFLAKELLTTERTYLKDLHVVTMSFQEAVGKEEVLPENVRKLISANYEPLLKFHQGFLREVEQRLAQWEGRSNAHIKGDYQRIGDILLKNIQGLKQLTVQLQKHPECLVELERACRSSRRLETLCGDFELQKACYLPLNLQGTMMKMENFQKLLELRKDLTGIDNLAIPGREFIRLGCLSKLSGKGLQQRMFFLVRESEDEWGVPHSFTLFGQRQPVVVAASSASEMDRWLEDIRMAVDLAEQTNDPEAHLLSTSLADRPFCLEQMLSGNLLRKFKNSNGWQKLWVVFTSFSLFFYKSHLDDYPLASLPLLGYSVTVPAESENIHKDYVFKLHFKSHVYYFRSESEYAFDRWMEVIRSATYSASRSLTIGQKDLY